MNPTPNTPVIEQRTPREQASWLINEYAKLKSILDAATAETRAKITAATAALNTASAPHLEKIEHIENVAKQLALEHGPAIFGEDRRSLTENGFTLGVRDTDAVQVEDEANAIRMLQRDAKAAKTKEGRMACNACLRVHAELDREYILNHIDDHDDAPFWFEQYGLSVVTKQSASLKPAPKPRSVKVKKLKTAEAPVESEAA